MSKPMSSAGVMGTEIEIIRKRYFIDYATKSEKHFADEYTLYCISENNDGIDNIFLKIPKILPNLRIFDADSEELPLITNTLFAALLRKNIRDAKIAKDTDAENRLNTILTDINERNYYVLWIKLPSNKRMKKGEAKVITLEYDARPDELNLGMHIQELKSEKYEVFYIIKPPEDYKISDVNFLIYDSKGNALKRHERKWENKKGEPIYFDPEHRNISVRIRPEITDQIVMSYTIDAQKSIVSLPKITLYFLITSSVAVFITNGLFAKVTESCFYSLCLELSDVHSKNIEISVGIIGASLIIAGFINNHDIRDSIKWRFFIPLIISVLALFLRI